MLALACTPLARWAYAGRALCVFNPCLVLSTPNVLLPPPPSAHRSALATSRRPTAAGPLPTAATTGASGSAAALSSSEGQAGQPTAPLLHKQRSASPTPPMRRSSALVVRTRLVE